MIKKECIDCIHMCSCCCNQGSCSTCRPYGFNFSPNRYKMCKIYGGRVTGDFLFNVGEKVVVTNLQLTSYDGCSAVSEMLCMSGKEAIITKRYFNISGRVRYNIEGSKWTWSEPMFIPKESNNRFDWLDKII